MINSILYHHVFSDLFTIECHGSGGRRDICRGSCRLLVLLSLHATQCLAFILNLSSILESVKIVPQVGLHQIG